MVSVVVVLMAAQAISGLAWRDQYRDADWIRLSWLGNDIVTLFGAVPLLLWASRRSSGPSELRQLIVAGVLAYAVYNSAFYLFGATLNVFFLLYVCVFLSSVLALIVVVTSLDVPRIHDVLGPGRRARAVGVALSIIGCGLASVWTVFWAAHVFVGLPTPVETDAFRLVAALDLSVLAPMFIGGGLLLFRGRPWGSVLAPVASIQGTIYLSVLALNSVLAIRAGLVAAPGELPLWGSLVLVTGGLAGVLLRQARGAGTRGRPSDGRPRESLRLL